MTFEEALKCMREGKKVIIPTRMYKPIFIADYTNGFGETYKAICYEVDGKLIYTSITHIELFAENWEVVDEVLK